ncbi:MULTISPECIES: peptidoglycan D,D-transpeptidase FtsI family protein [Bacillus]|uniref:peptidoglycan D,D-transpeptidase FtsI family protein n=1 Tax=Bacillus TaxID=1386 RepID=UPI0003A5B22B|nr:MULTISPECIES: penicillin-binding protein 2 [Bacillus]AIK36399.1 penicillin binding transpeptidase domain protein [Bacillus pseudomycoides]AJI19888.1 penicillin binding transpeptidase domain protein [Bacillus pseudomycoides]PEB42326.1 penicillin-binding protein 2 [Bacillus pseudomycoides]PEM36275.1 penicillin-binding protein 2 [Bacillus pseudomycoides]PGD92952.1 penicillin-binding protein 2 [Bacillus pseudomycoides]
MKIKRRIIITLLCFTCIMLLLLGRLVQIQLISTESFTDKHINLIEKSVTQRTQAVTVDDGRGRFIDRNGVELGEEKYSVLIIFPFLQIKNDMLEKIAHIISVPGQDINLQMKDKRKPFIFQRGDKPFQLTKEQVEKINRADMLGMVATEVRVKQIPEAEHLIGAVGENENEFQKRYGEMKKFPIQTPIGISGLQQSFDEFLMTDGETKVLYQVDRQGEPIFGKRAKYTSPGNPFYPVTIQTTIEKSLQQKAEELVQMHGIKNGGLVLLDVKKSEILAMVSKPSLQTNDKRTYQKTMENQMLTPHFPGSIFKTVVAAAAIDNDIIQSHRMFNCDTDPYGENTPQVMMGKLSFTESFARSCNRTFAVLGDELMQKDKHVMETYLEALGASEKVGWKGQVFHTSGFKQLIEEKKAIVWNEEETKMSHKAIAQTAIGQKDVRISPLAVANMMATIARNGEKKEVKAVKEIRYKNGTRFFHFEDHKLEGRQLSYHTVKQVQSLLRKVVTMEKGTGTTFQSLPLSVAGKSGTAQTGKGNRVNRWFAGYFPYENPRYALVVVDLETNNEQNTVTPIFKEFVEEIAHLESRR